MKIVFKVIAIIGILSFLGGLKNGVFFILGLILAGIFGYFGWRPEKKIYEQKHSSDDFQNLKSKKPSNNFNINEPVDEEFNDNKEKTEVELKAKIEDYKNKIDLLNKSYEQGLLTEQEFKSKKGVLEIKKNKLNQNLDDQIARKLIIVNNKVSFDRLTELKESGLINSNEYKLKFEQLQSKFLTNSIEKDFDSKDHTEAQIKTNKKNKIGLSLLIVILCVFSCLIYFSNSIDLLIGLYLNKKPETTNLKESQQLITSKTLSYKNSSNMKKETILDQKPSDLPEFGILKDYDENSYKTVKIGGQIWMAENLNVSHFRNGEPIKEAKSKEEWMYCSENKVPAWCHFENNPFNSKVKGKLYNLWAAIDNRGLAPLGWNVPNSEEYMILERLFGGFRKAGKFLKSKDFPGGGTNKSGFNVKYVGERKYDGEFIYDNQSQHFWTKTTGSGWGDRWNSISGKIAGVYLDRNWGGIAGSALDMTGLPIRCIKE
jgi:uncharacterized protein (TIGR02145 family)